LRFAKIPVVSLEGRMFPVEVCYLKGPVVDYCEAAVETVFNIHMKVGEHSSVVFCIVQELTNRNRPAMYSCS